MKRGRTPFLAKLRPEMAVEVADDPKGRGKMLLPTPTILADEIGRVPKKRLISVSSLRSRIARRHGADFACPLMTGIFFNILAGAVEEQLADGKSPLCPYWRVVQDDGALSPKTPDGPERQAEHLRAEGHDVRTLRGRLRVTAFAENAVK